MSQTKLYFPPGETFDGFLSEIETPRGEHILARLENRFGTVSNLFAHTSLVGPDNGADTLVHMGHGNTILFENIPHIDFVGFVAETAILFGIPA